MAVIEINRYPSARELRVFGLLLLAFVALVGGLVYWRTESVTAAGWVWGGGAVLTAVYFALPPLRRWIYLGWLYAVFPIGWTISHLLLGMVYFLIIAPIGLLVRLTSHDPMLRKRDPSVSTYWVKRDKRGGTRAYFRQF